MKHLSHVPVRHIEQLIHVIRGQKIVLGPDLAGLYGVSTRVLMQAVRRNLVRFPDDFMFELTREEIQRMSQFVTSLKYSKSSFAFTEHGVAMLSGVLRSPKAVQINIEIIRAFIRLRHLLDNNKQLAAKVEALEKTSDERFAVVFRTLRQLIEPPERPKRRIGY